MGAHAAGELASKLAVDHISHNYFKLRDLYPPAALRQAIRDANNSIHAKGQSSIGFQGMGTTCSCLVLLPQGALVAHIGDSRVYRLRGDLLEQTDVRSQPGVGNGCGGADVGSGRSFLHSQKRDHAIAWTAPHGAR